MATAFAPLRHVPETAATFLAQMSCTIDDPPPYRDRHGRTFEGAEALTQYEALVQTANVRMANLVDRAIAGRDWFAYLFTHPKHLRARALKSIANGITDREYWRLLGEVWTDAEAIGTTYRGPMLEQMFRSPRPGRHHLMSTYERRTFRSLPDTVRVYRGVAAQGRKSWDGLSWTLSRRVARYFANRRTYSGEPTLLVGEISKIDAYAYFSRRKERELVCPIGSVRVLSALPI